VDPDSRQTLEDVKMAGDVEEARPQGEGRPEGGFRPDGDDMMSSELYEEPAEEA
jgi:small subunit ribosomal protein S6